MRVTTIGIDLAKHDFQVHGVDAAGGLIVRHKLRRSKACLEEIAFQSGWIDSDVLREASLRFAKSGYGDYLNGLVRAARESLCDSHLE
jgi:dTDP-glucose pyrophosphorylase